MIFDKTRGTSSLETVKTWKSKKQRFLETLSINFTNMAVENLALQLQE